MPKFSIIIPVYDVEKYIKKCLDSVFNQTYNNYEVIVVNDGTKDNSMEIVKNYNVITINQKNQGLSMARNNGVKKAKGEYLLFLDSDDYLEENTLEEINKALDSKPDIVRFQIKEVGSEVNKNYPEEPFNNLNGENAFKRIVNYHFVENAWCYAIYFNADYHAACCDRCDRADLRGTHLSGACIQKDQGLRRFLAGGHHQRTGLRNLSREYHAGDLCNDHGRIVRYDLRALRNDLGCDRGAYCK